MARKPTSLQHGLFRRDIPKMPDGYYSSGPNPNLRRFVLGRATLHDPAVDDYDVQALDARIIDESASEIYDMHPYWAKKPHGAIAQYIEHFTAPGDLVLDPFTGSGGVNAVAEQLGRASIGIDLSPAATFIAKHLCTPFPLEKLQAAYRQMMSDLQPVHDKLYAVTCRRCAGRAETQYVVWSQTYKCGKCLEIVPYYGCQDRCCPHCGQVISTSQQRYGYVPVLANVKCLEGCRPARSERAIDSSGAEDRTAFRDIDLQKIAEIESAIIPYWYPTEEFPTTWVSWRPNLAEAGSVSGFFTKRNLWAAAAIVDWIDSHRHIEATSWLMFAFTASIMSISKKAQHLDEGGGYIPGNYVFPPQIKERNVFNSYNTIFEKILRGVAALNQRVLTTDVIISTQSALDLREIPDASIDYIFTDPPYSDKVPFGEFNFLWEVWLRRGLSWNQDEIIVNPQLGRSLTEWKQMLKQAVEEMYRVLKPGRFASVCYHDSAEGSWTHLQDVFAEVGFVTEQADTVLSIERTRKSWKQATTVKVQKRDLVINFRKPRGGKRSTHIVITGEEGLRTFSEKAQSIVTSLLRIHPGTPRDRLYDEVVSHMVQRGEFERHDFDRLLGTVAEQVNGRWYLLETADQVDEAESARESAAAARLEGFMRVHLTAHPYEQGVHYSDLFEQYLPVQDKPRRLLADWLPEYFQRTIEGTWRPPTDDEERAAKALLRTTGVLRRIKRFANALIEGVPPSDRDRPTNVATAADWIRQCRRAGLYELGRAMYEKGGFGFGVLSEDAQVEVMEDYELCARRTT